MALPSSAVSLRGLWNLLTILIHETYLHLTQHYFTVMNCSTTVTALTMLSGGELFTIWAGTDWPVSCYFDGVWTLGWLTVHGAACHCSLALMAVLSLVFLFCRASAKDTPGEMRLKGKTVPVFGMGALRIFLRRISSFPRLHPQYLDGLGCSHPPSPCGGGLEYLHRSPCEP
jgi:hypothetical protein